MQRFAAEWWPQDGPGSATKKWDGGTINGQLTNQNVGTFIQQTWWQNII